MGENADPSGLTALPSASLRAGCDDKSRQRRWWMERLLVRTKSDFTRSSQGAKAGCYGASLRPTGKNACPTWPARMPSHAVNKHGGSHGARRTGISAPHTGMSSRQAWMPVQHALHGFLKLLPGDEDEALVFQEFLEVGIADDVVVVLAPLRAPVGVVGGSALDFGVVVREVDDEFVGPGRQRGEHLLIGVEPLGLGNAWRDLENAIDDDRFGIDLGGRIELVDVDAGIGCLGEEDGQLVLGSEADVDGEKIGRGEKRAHVRVKMGEMNSGGLRFVDLGASFGFDVAHFRVGDNIFGKEWEISIAVEQAGTFWLRGNGTPTEGGPVGVQGEVDAEVGVGMRLSPGGDFGKLGTRHHDAGGGDPTFFHGFFDGGIYGVHHSEVVGVDDEQARVRGIAETLRGIGLGKESRGDEEECES